jgi:hypothetical protein
MEIDTIHISSCFNRIFLVLIQISEAYGGLSSNCGS